MIVGGTVVMRYVVLICALALAGCATDSYYGRGPIVLNPSMERCFENYLAHDNPRYFALAVNGRTCGYTYCPTQRCDSLDLANALSYCESRSHGVPCKVFAYQRRIVWEIAPGQPALASPPPTPDPSAIGPDISCRSRIGVVSTMKEHLCRRFGGEVIR